METSTGWKAGVGMALALFATSAVAQKMERPAPPPPGLSWVQQMQDSGSFGAGQRELEVRTVEASWEGRKFIGMQSAAGTTLLTETGEWFGLLGVDGKLTVRWEPPISYDWPLEAGKNSVKQYQVKLPGSEQLVPMEYRMVVEGMEEVTVPAGTFRTFRIRTSDSLGNAAVEWYSPDLKVWVKRSMERTDKHAAGPGRREIVLKSQAIRGQ